MPRTAKICQSNFRFWPILSTPRIFQKRLHRVERCALRQSGRARARPGTDRRCRRRPGDATAARSRLRSAPAPAKSRTAPPASDRANWSRCRCATKPRSRARSIQALSRSSERTVSYFERSNFCWCAMSSRAFASACGVSGASPLPFRERAAGAAGRVRAVGASARPSPGSALCAEPPSPGSGEGEEEAPLAVQASHPARLHRHRSRRIRATRRVSEENSIALRKAIRRL